MHHQNKVESESEATIARRTRIGLILLAVYGLAYSVFIGLCAFASKSMADFSPWGIPFAIWYGMGLMVGAILMALLYGRLCQAKFNPN
ncbi:MAG: DUF485 domain-containing protein [Pirellulaceae bacterium]|nr:DUF485 domain-containing protein [Pirellulaceae bacterium]